MVSCIMGHILCVKLDRMVSTTKKRKENMMMVSIYVVAICNVWCVCMCVHTKKEKQAKDECSTNNKKESHYYYSGINWNN